MWKFEPILKPTIWGGNKIFSYRGEESQESNIGESWLISGLEGDETLVTGGFDGLQDSTKVKIRKED